MKKLLSIAVVVTTLVTSSAWASSSISFTNSGTAGVNDGFVNIPLGKFDTGLGTLTGVVVTVNFLSVGGSFDITSAGIPSSVTSVGTIPVLQASSPSLGFTDFNTGFSSYTVSTSPSAPPFSVPANTTQTFNVTPQDIVLNDIQNINSSFWSAYQSVGGVGNVVFAVANFPNIGISGSGFSLNADLFEATANMTVTYNYVDPIPEPGTWAIGALLLGGAAYTFWRRRQNTVIEPSATA